MAIEMKNAKITSTKLGFEDHGFFTFSIGLDYGGAGQCVGSYALDDYDKEIEKRVGTEWGSKLIMRLLEVVGVDNWEDIKGKLIRVKSEFHQVHAIGNILKDDWIDFKDFFKDQGGDI